MLMQLNQNQTGKSVGQGIVASAGEYGELLVSELQARYYEWVYRGLVFTAANTSAQATSTGPNSTATGLILSNPAGSGVNAVILDASIAIASLPAGAATLVWAANVNPIGAATTHTIALAPQSALLGSGKKSACFADSSATLPSAPTIVRPIGGGPAATVASSTAFPPFIRDEVAGGLIVTPGCAISIQSITTAVSIMASILWAEIPV